MVGHYDKDVDNTDILLSYLLTKDPPADVNERSITIVLRMELHLCGFPLLTLTAH